MPNISQVRIAVFLIVFLQSCATKALGENSLQKIEAQPSNTEIARIEQRGKEIAEYERTAIQSTDLTLAANPDLSKLELYVAQKEQSTWWAYYGKLSENDEEFQIAYNYACTDKSCILQTARSVTKELIVLDGSAHAQFLFQTDQADRVMKEVLHFLAGTELSPVKAPFDSPALNQEGF